MNKTYIPKKKNINLKKQWHIIDAKNQTLGRLSTLVASILRGKHEVDYTPYLINKNFIIIINSQDIRVTGNKNSQKMYKRHSGRPGGLKSETFQQLNKRLPNRILEKCIKGMLPKGPLGKQLFRQLKVYPNNHHPHIAQKPNTIYIN